MKDRFRKLITGKRIPLLLAAVLLLLCVPVIGMVASAGGTDTRVVDPSTMDTWTNYFGPSQPKTEYAGDVWMDKSVLTDASALPAGIAMEGSENESFLVALSAMASNSSITGQATYPTDTILVLDVSGSMNSGGNDAGADLAAAANSSIATLQNANPNNRVALVLYSGDTGNSASSAVTLLPLGRWTTAADGIYINYESTGGFFGRESLGVDEDVRDAVGGGNPATNETDISGATYIQRGISQAMNMFTATDNEVTVDGQQRLPVLVLMSDGAPTLSSTNFTNPGAHNLGNGQTSSITAGQGFVTQLTAAYAKTQIEAKYGTDMLFYTLGFRVDADSVAESVLNPTGSIAAIDNFWSSYDAASVGSTVFVQDGASVTKIGTALSQNYVTSYFSASSDLQAVFQNIISDSLLQSKYSPTLVEGNENMDGLISFVDRIGAYMEVKNIQGILIHDDLFSGADLSSNFVPGGGLLGDYANPTEMGIALVSAVQQRLGIADYNVAANLLGLAYTHGQLAYTDDTNFSNYVGWYANAAGEYLGFWHEGVTTPPETTGNAATDPAFKVKSYYYLGEVDESHGVSKSDMMYAVVQLRENISTGDQILTFGIPSALIPTTSYEVELDEYDTLQGLTVSGAEQPMRLVYEVGLRDEINSLTVQDANIVDPAYVSANRNPDGSINFYTNEYERDGSVGYGAANSYSYFRPSHQNERYYYQADAMIYTDTAGTLYNSTTAPAAGTAYYNRRSIYSNIGGLHEEYVYHEIAEESLETAAPLGDGSWYIPAGNILASMADYQMAKSVNSTATLGNYADAFVDLRDSNGNPIGVAAPGHDYVVGSTLGNNGRLSISPSVGILLRKDLEAGTADTGETFMFTITGSAADAGQTYPGYLMDVDKSLSPVSTSFDASGVARVGLKAGQRLFITEMTESRGYTITEDESVEYILHSVNGDTSATQANVITQEEGLVNVGFVNARRGKGEFTLIKMLEHDLGAEHTIPSDLDFLISVQLSGVGTANASFPAELSGMGSTTVTTDATGSFSYYLKDQEHLLVSDLPIGTEVVVTENVGALDPGFSHRGFYDDGIIGGDGRVSISGSNSVVVVNGYEADPVHPVDLDLTVEKRVELADGTEVTDWSDREFNFVLSRYNADTGTWDTVATQTSNNSQKSFSFDLSGEDYSAPGSYSYRVVEEAGTEEGMYYDPVIRSFTVVVSDADMDGQLDISRVYSIRSGAEYSRDPISGKWNVDMDFTNVLHSVSPAYIAIPIQKIMNNPSNSPLASLAGYEFGVYADAECSTALSSSSMPGVLDVNAFSSGLYGDAFVYVSFDAAGTYTFYLKETAGSETYIDYSDVVVSVSITVDADAAGQLYTVGAPVYTPDTVLNTTTYEVEFENSYEPDPASLDLSAHLFKNMDGRALNAGDVFTFEVREAYTDTLRASGSSQADGSIVFDTPLSFTEVGNYDFIARETSPDGNGVTTDKTGYHFRVTVSDNGSGELVTTLSVAEGTGGNIYFNNVYQANAVSYQISGSKILDGAALSGGQFSFRMQEADASGNALPGGRSWQNTNDAAGNFLFPELTYTEPGDYYYSISEIENTLMPGIQFDESIFLIHVKVEDDAMGQLQVSVDVDGDPAKEILFRNSYVPQPVKVPLDGIKFLDGRDSMTAGTYEFELYSSDAAWSEGSLLETVANAADGRFSFSLLGNATVGGERVFDAPGSYYYLVKEKNGGSEINGIIYSSEVQRVRVDVSDNGRGLLEAVVNIYSSTGIPQAGVSFTNEARILEGKSLLLTGLKTLSGKTLESNQFHFNLYEADSSYTKGALLDTVSNTGNSFQFEIAYEPEDLGKTFYYLVEEQYGGTQRDNINYDGRSYRVSVQVGDNGDRSLLLTQTVENGPILFENSYIPNSASVTFSGTKSLTGRALAAGEFSFDLYAADAAFHYSGAPLRSTTNAADGSFSFGALILSEAKTYNFVIKENSLSPLSGITYDTKHYNCAVVVEDVAGQLQITSQSIADNLGNSATSADFENSYDPADAHLSLSGTKSLSGRALQNGEFRFLLYKAEDASYSVSSSTIPSETVNAADGSFTFDSLHFDTAGSYYYVVKEDSSLLVPHVSMDPREYKIEITVVDNGGQLEASYKLDGSETTAIAFENIYTPDAGSTSFSGTKSLNGRALAADEFSFELFKTDDSFTVADPAIMTVKNAADGSFSFADVPLSTAGNYYFVIRESAAAPLPGMSYDSRSYCISLQVADVDGVYTVTSQSITEAGNPVTEILFENDYTVTPTSTSFSGTKSLSGRALAADEFSFELFKTDDSFALVDPAIMEVKNAADGSFSFADVPLTTVGTHYFVIREKSTPLLPGVSYDSTSYFLTVVVEDVDAVLAVSSLSISNGLETVTELSFENSYAPLPTSTSFTGTKSLTGRALAAEEFSFELFKTDDSFTVADPAIMTVKNAADGSFSFADVPLTTVGTHYFVIRESAAAPLPGVSYDSRSYFLTVVVEDVGGSLGVSSQSLADENGIVTELRFENSYAAAPTSTSFSGTKSLIGRTLVADAFSFELFKTDDSFALVNPAIM
ncbi:MAG: FctA domain-containing protein, partial [Bacillota bacterium]|nr:FctA domain-containing protein [Bacillota bacterium]